MSEITDRDVAFIRALAELLREADLTEIEVSREYGDDDELTVRLVRAPQEAPPAPAPVYRVEAAAPPVAADARAPAPPAEHGAAVPDDGETVTSPMVGTVYLAAEPGAAQFVQVGDLVSEGQTLLIVEAMKTMNQIPSPRGGTVKAILVANAEPVEYGAPLVVIG
ncbi:MAG: acetyl-CoA carboxylase biotin carboxyl carrier protein [Paracoccaceae bacterium]